MTFLISPQEAQAMQEDEAQLLAAIAQAGRGAIALTLLRQVSLPVVQDSSTLRIQLGRRLVYGKLADGPFRNELDANSLKVISDALQRPEAKAVNLSLYRGKIPAIEIRDGSTILFREERDGTVTANQIQMQLNLEKQAQPEDGELATDLDAFSNSDKTHTDELTSPINSNEFAQIATYLLNPLGAESPIYDAVSIGEYRIKRSGDGIAVSRGEKLILVVLEGEVVTDQVAIEDWNAFQNFRGYPTTSSEIDNEFLVDLDQELDEIQEEYTLNSSHEENIPPAIAILERETEKLHDGATKQLLCTTVQSLKQQVIQGLSTSVQQGIGWLSRRPAVLRNKRLAGAVLDLFHRGYERTGQRIYHVGEYSISLKGKNLYILHDRKQELLRFKAFKSPFALNKLRVQLISASDRISEFQHQDILTMQRNKTLTPQGDADIEAQYAAKIRVVEQTVRKFLQNHARANVWDKEDGRFKLEVGSNDFLQITDKCSNRGVIFRRQNREVFSKLGPKDFAHFKRLATRMNKQQLQGSQTELLGVSSAKQTTGIELG